jgi:hypothetical protein
MACGGVREDGEMMEKLEPGQVWIGSNGMRTIIEIIPSYRDSMNYIVFMGSQSSIPRMDSENNFHHWMKRMGAKLKYIPARTGAKLEGRDGD